MDSLVRISKPQTASSHDSMLYSLLPSLSFGNKFLGFSHLQFQNKFSGVESFSIRKQFSGLWLSSIGKNNNFSWVGHSSNSKTTIFFFLGAGGFVIENSFSWVWLFSILKTKKIMFGHLRFEMKTFLVLVVFNSKSFFLEEEGVRAGSRWFKKNVIQELSSYCKLTN